VSINKRWRYRAMEYAKKKLERRGFEQLCYLSIAVLLDRREDRLRKGWLR
jgi:hypothetical protein